MWTIDVIILRLRGYLRIVGEEGSTPGATRSNCCVMTGCCRGSHLGMSSVLIRREGEGVCRLKSHRRWSSGMVIPEGGRCSACSGVGDCGVPCGTHNLKNRCQRSGRGDDDASGHVEPGRLRPGEWRLSVADVRDALIGAARRGTVARAVDERILFAASIVLTLPTPDPQVPVEPGYRRVTRQESAAIGTPVSTGEGETPGEHCPAHERPLIDP
ncbi:hypothetical protein [Streptomyces sp. NPDC001893]|uniref:hypothetical protein n=1 Tax=Streptomyces sp. NPDC001893 TaxID=3154530 RepID=UPI00331D51B2